MTHQTTPARTAWLARIRELRLAGSTLDEARAIAGPMPDSTGLDALADQITIGVLIEAFAEYGITPRAFCAAFCAVSCSDAFERSDARAGTVRDD